MKTNVLQYLEEGALRETPASIFIVDRAEELSFEEAYRKSRQIAARLLLMDPLPGGPIAVFLPKSAEVILCDLAILQVGSPYMNVDHKSPTDRLRALLSNVQPELVITSSELSASLTTAGWPADRVVVLNEPFEGDITAQIELDLHHRRSQVLDVDPVCLINTSGSTGIPKSVVLSHRGTIDFIDWCLSEFDFDEEDIIGSLSPLYFDIFTLELFVSLSRGSTLHLIPESTAAFPAKLVTHLEECSATFIFWVPTVMVNIANLNLLSGSRLPALKRIFYAGEVFPTRQLNYWRRNLPAREFVNLYGPIEITVDCTFFRIDREFEDDEIVPIGHPCANTEILILNENGDRVSPGEVGELYVRGSSLALGYYNNRELTAKAFVQNPLHSRYPDILYKTGDLVHLNEFGELVFNGRRDFQIKHFGYRIELGEIENAALAIPEVRNACVLYNATEKDIVLIYESDRQLESNYCRRLILAKLPKYMVPTVFHFIDAMPRNPNGKIDRNLLRLRFIENL